MGTSPPGARRSQRLAVALSELGQDEASGRLAPLTRYTPLSNPRDPPQRSFVTDLRLSPAQRTRNCYSPHWLQRLEAPGCGLVPFQTFLSVHGYVQNAGGVRILSLPPPSANEEDESKTFRWAIEHGGISAATEAAKVVSTAQSKSKIFHERKPLASRSSHNYRFGGICVVSTRVLLDSAAFPFVFEDRHESRWPVARSCQSLSIEPGNLLNPVCGNNRVAWNFFPVEIIRGEKQMNGCWSVKATSPQP
mmetsp:Transcript_10130/g.24141  ORF Transcript_10130/g.24141 Transcript_10130/m.24141 type:complete len:249 (-) Transcript_10130:43-789(-)